MVVVAGCRDVPLESGGRGPVIVASPGEHRRLSSPGYRGHPPRSLLVRAERGNPVGVRTVGSGQPTVRKAQLLGGQRMTKKRMPAAETQRETGTR
jgi:hypothetical protein